MNDFDKYKQTFSRLHSTVAINEEDFKTMKHKHKLSKSAAIIAVAAILFAGSTVTAYATNLFGLRDLFLLKTESEAITDESTGETYETAPMTIISLQGFPDSAEYMAAAEWLNFTENYDTDGAILSVVGNDPTGFEEKYGCYLVYSQEMADKLDEIVAKYGLQLHSAMYGDFQDRESLYAQAGTGDFLGDTNYMQSNYVYEDGSIHIDGYCVLPEGNIVDFQFSNYKKGSFSDVFLNVGDFDNYSEWEYTTKSGVTVSLALGPDKGLILANLDDSFMSVNVLSGTEITFLEGEMPITSADLEIMADSFDFSAL
ncbi:MAG: hypothetical protein LBQ95_01905 [Lachnospiraceae bacterium]|jgi:hypothetical protein|nr:hypothetical protein [Lachnospiraceae bacterium]